VDAGGADVTVAPDDEYTEVDVKSDHVDDEALGFTVTFGCSEARQGERLEVEFAATVADRSVATATAIVECGVLAAAASGADEPTDGPPTGQQDAPDQAGAPAAPGGAPPAPAPAGSPGQAGAPASSPAPGSAGAPAHSPAPGQAPAPTPGQAGAPAAAHALGQAPAPTAASTPTPASAPATAPAPGAASVPSPAVTPGDSGQAALVTGTQPAGTSPVVGAAAPAPEQEQARLAHAQAARFLKFSQVRQELGPPPALLPAAGALAAGGFGLALTLGSRSRPSPVGAVGADRRRRVRRR
jgi:hypothetical protein